MRLLFSNHINPVNREHLGWLGRGNSKNDSFFAIPSWYVLGNQQAMKPFSPSCEFRPCACKEGHVCYPFSILPPLLRGGGMWEYILRCVLKGSESPVGYLSGLLNGCGMGKHKGATLVEGCSSPSFTATVPFMG